MNNKKATIYTGTGDDGTTSLIGGERVSKDNQRVQAYGTIDELNAHLGMLNVVLEDEHTKSFIENIEHNMLNIGCSLADSRCRREMPNNDEIETLQKEIDRLEASLPAMHDFIIPGGTEVAARANLCRTVCRRAEREIISLQRNCEISQNIIVYMNRLSDYLFMLQRQLLGGNEKKWKKSCK